MPVTFFIYLRHRNSNTVLMKRKNRFALLILLLLVFTCFGFISYSHRASEAADAKECTDDSKCDQKKTQTEFILWESLSRNLFGSNG